MEKEHEIKTVVPALRFPEFREMEGWRHNIVNNLTSVITAPKKITSQEYLNTGYYPIIDQSQNYICGWTNDESAVITEASLSQPLIIFGDHTCILKKVTFPFAQGADGIKILKTKECINGFFLYQILLANPVTQEEYKRHYSILKEKTIYYPIINSGEQQKIADCLSSLDDLIEATNRKIEALKEHKKGLIQRLFPKEEENVPELRFPEFQGTKGWDKCILGDSLLEHPRYGINAPAVPFQKELATYIRITDISENGTFSPNPKVSVNKDNVDNFYLSMGDLVFARTGASVGKCYKYREKDGKLVFAGFLIKITPNSTKLLSDFLFQYTFSEQYWEWVHLTSTRSGQPGINSKELFSMPFRLPTIQEQQKIAACLSSLDELIEATSQKVEILKEHKKGLMQQMFPKI